jgi:ABC-type bacteriocin/lantibiotic exporter with double-glycine peptidase domain
MGIILNALGAVVCALTIAFITGWKLSLVVLCFTPLMVFAGMLQGKRMSQQKKVKEKKSFGDLSCAEQGGMVKIYLFIINKYDEYI